MNLRRVATTAFALLAIFASLTSGVSASETSSTPSATEVNPEQFYEDVASGEKDGIIVFSTPGSNAEILVYCSSGLVTYSLAGMSDLPVRPDYKPVSCSLDNLLSLTSVKSFLIVNDDPLDGWTIDGVQNEAEYATRCVRGNLQTATLSGDGNPLISTEYGATACRPGA